MLVGANDDGINDQIFEVGIIRHRGKDMPPYTLAAPSAEASKDAAPLAEHLRQIAAMASRCGLALKLTVATKHRHIKDVKLANALLSNASFQPHTFAKSNPDPPPVFFDEDYTLPGQHPFY